MCYFLLTCSILLHTSIVSFPSLIWSGDKYIGIQSLILWEFGIANTADALLVFQNSPFLCPSNLCFVQHTCETPCKVLSHLVYEEGVLEMLRHEGPLAVVLGQWLVELEGKYLQLRYLWGIIYIDSLGSSIELECQLLTAVICSKTYPLLANFFLCFSVHFPTSLLAFLSITFQIKHSFARF